MPRPAVPGLAYVPKQARPSLTTGGRLTWSPTSHSLDPDRPTLGPGAAPGATGAGPAPILAMATRHFRPELSEAEAAVLGGSSGQSHSARAGPKERPPGAGSNPGRLVDVWKGFRFLFCGTKVSAFRVGREGQVFGCSGKRNLYLIKVRSLIEE